MMKIWLCQKASLIKIMIMSGKKNMLVKISNPYMMRCLISKHSVKKEDVNFNNTIKI
jgi:hypothetical protein